MTGLEPTEREVADAVAWALSHVRRAGFAVCDEVESEVGFTVALCYDLYRREHRRHPFALYASRAAYNRCLRLFVRRAASRRACVLLGWQDVEVEDGARLPVRRALRDLVAVLPDSLAPVARDVWLHGVTRTEVSRRTGMTRRQVADALERAAIWIADRND